LIDNRLDTKNNTYKNNNTDNVLGAGGLAWLGYRLDMAGLACSNHVRPTKIFQIFIIIIFTILLYIIHKKLRLYYELN
jgi:hypothetical protein